MTRSANITICALLISPLLALASVSAESRVDEIISTAIEKRFNDKQTCKSYTCTAIKKEIKYDGDFNPKETKTLRMMVYHVDSVETAEVLYMDKDGAEVDREKILNKVEEMNDKWREEQEDEEKGSREDFVDPMTEEGRSDYAYELLDTRDSTFATIAGAVTATDSLGGQVVIDESIDKLLTYYVVRATTSIEDQKHINATYWIDAETFGVLHQEFSPAKLPRFVHRLDFELDFQQVRMNGEIVYLPQRFELKGKAGFLFFKGHFGVVETFAKYKCDPSLASPPSEKRYFYRGDEKRES